MIAPEGEHFFAELCEEFLDAKNFSLTSCVKGTSVKGLLRTVLVMHWGHKFLSAYYMRKHPKDKNCKP